jgi:hypothetical protein
MEDRIIDNLHTNHTFQSHSSSPLVLNYILAPKSSSPIPTGLPYLLLEFAAMTSTFSELAPQVFGFAGCSPPPRNLQPILSHFACIQGATVQYSHLHLIGQRE